MKPHPRLRKSVKWVGAIASLVLLTFWIGSGKFHVERWHSDGSREIHVTLHGGCMYFSEYTSHWFVAPTGTGWRFELFPMHLRWWFDRGNNNLGMGPYWGFPLWVPTTPILLITAAAWRLDILARRRARTDRCIKCGYDLAGLSPSAVCPECGRATAPSTTPPAY